MLVSCEYGLQEEPQEHDCYVALLVQYSSCTRETLRLSPTDARELSLLLWKWLFLNWIYTWLL